MIKKLFGVAAVVLSVLVQQRRFLNAHRAFSGQLLEAQEGNWDEIELMVREQLASGDLEGDETLAATATVTVAGLSRDVVVTGKISLAR